MPVVCLDKLALGVAKDALGDFGLHPRTGHQRPRRPSQIVNAPISHAAPLIELRLVKSRMEGRRRLSIATGEHIWIINEPRLDLDDIERDFWQSKGARVSLLS